MGLSIDIDAVKVENNKALAGGAHEKQGFRVNDGDKLTKDDKKRL